MPVTCINIVLYEDHQYNDALITGVYIIIIDILQTL